MSKIAQSRDLSDRRTIMDFAQIVQTTERLKLLLVLTVCDIRAVGPGVWNGWKGQLLRALYFETEPILTGGFSAASHEQRLAEARAALAERLADWPEAERERDSRPPLPRLLAARRRGPAGPPRGVRARCRQRRAEARLRDPADGFRGGDGAHRARPRPSAAAFRASPAPAPRATPTSSTRRSSRPPTGVRSTRSSSAAPSTLTRTRCGAASASPADRAGAGGAHPARRGARRQAAEEPLAAKPSRSSRR